MKKIFSIFLLSIYLTLFVAPSARAVTITPQPPDTATEPAIVITSFGGNRLLDFAELYNQSDEPVNLEGWTLEFTVAGTVGTTAAETTVAIESPAGWLPPEQYFSFERAAASASGAAFSVNEAVVLDGFSNVRLAEVRLLDADNREYAAISIPSGTLAATAWAQHKQRTKATLIVTGTFATDYAVKTTSPALFSDALYVPPADAGGLAVLEILPNARTCSPIEQAIDCGDYVKLYNATSAPIDISLYRLRSDSGGLSSTASNTFTLDGLLLPGAYKAVNLKDSGDALSLTNTGGYVWLEDIYGAKKYLPMYSYPDASADSKKGLFWALDAADNVWKWMEPAPGGSNYWAPVLVSVPDVLVTVTASTALSDCGPGKERNPETNRCRSLVTAAASALTPCKAGQERNLDTNRCRSTALLSASTSLVPCGPGEFRNPETNRCKKGVVAAASTLAPCAAGQERNPATNRCRKAATAGSKIADVKDIKAGETSGTTGWLFTGAVVLTATSYAIYE